MRGPQHGNGTCEREDGSGGNSAPQRDPGDRENVFTRWLESQGWIRIETDRLGSSVHELAWTSLLGGGDQASFREVISATGKSVAIEWGFHPPEVERIRQLREFGFDCWWLDGDRDAAYAAWCIAWQADEGRTTTGSVK